MREANSDFPAPEAPRTSTPCAPARIAVPCTVSLIERRSVGRGQGHREAGALDALGAQPVLGPDGATMRFHDLARDGQPQPRILAELVAFRTVGIEALENAVDILGAD